MDKFQKEKKLTRWDLNILRQKVRAVHGEEQFQKLNPCLNSIKERQIFAQFHFDQAEEAIGGYLDDNMKDEDLFMIMLSPKTRNRHDFNINRVKAKAHIHACLQNMHCIADTLSHVVYFSLALKNAKKESSISLTNVCDWICKKSQYDVLAELINELTSSDNYKYLEAIVNHSKHRSIIEAELGIALSPGEPSPTFKFTHFFHKGNEYSKRSIREYVADEFSRQSKLIVAIGNETNRLVSLKQYSPN